MPVSRPAMAERETLLRVWGLDPIGEVRRSRIPSGELTCLALSPDGKQALSGCGGPVLGGDPAVRVWDLETSKPVRPLVGHTGGVGRVAYSSDRKKVVSGCTGEG